jgi:hypothetical protein
VLDQLLVGWLPVQQVQLPCSAVSSSCRSLAALLQVGAKTLPKVAKAEHRRKILTTVQLRNMAVVS